MTVLVVRPDADAVCTVDRLAERGIAAIASPASRITPVAADLPDGCAAIVVTSANAVPALAAREDLSALPLYAVGDRTAEIARTAGFASVRSAAGALGDLVALIAARCDPSDGPLLYACGRDTAGDLAAELGEAGFDVRKAVVYEAAAVESLTVEAASALASGRVRAVLLYSPRGATLFGELAASAGLRECLGRTTAICMSRRIAECASSAGFGHVRAADSPDEPALIAALEGWLAEV